MNIKVFSVLPCLAAFAVVVHSYGYKFSRRPGSSDCKLQLNLPGYPPSYHEEYTQNRYSNKFTDAERNKQQSGFQQTQGGYGPGDMVECRRGEVYSLRLKKCVRNDQGSGGSYGSSSGSSSTGSYGGSSGQNYGGSAASGSYGGSSGGSYGGSSGGSGSYGGSSGGSGSYGGGTSGQRVTSGGSGSYGGSSGGSGSYGGGTYGQRETSGGSGSYSGSSGGSYGGSSGQRETSGGSGSYGGGSSGQRESFGGSSAGSGSYGGGTSGQRESFGGSSAGSGSYGGSSGGSTNYGGSSGGSYGGSSGQRETSGGSGSYGGGSSGQRVTSGGSSGGSGSYGGATGQRESYGSSSGQRESYGGSSPQSGSYGSVTHSSTNYESDRRRPSGFINSGNKGVASSNIAASYEPTDEHSGESHHSSSFHQTEDNRGHPSSAVGGSYGSSFEEQTYEGGQAPLYEEDRYSGVSHAEDSYGSRPSSTSLANIGGGLYEDKSFSGEDSYPSYGTGGVRVPPTPSSFIADNRRKQFGSSSNIGAAAAAGSFSSSSSSGPGGVTAIVSNNLRPQGNRDTSYGGGSFSSTDGGSRVTSGGSGSDTAYDREINTKPIEFVPSVPSYGGPSDNSFTSEKKKYSFASSSSKTKEEEESTFIASGPPLEPVLTGSISSFVSDQSSSSSEFLKFASDALEAHNRYREIHGAVPLILDPKLSEAAQNLADKFATGQETFRHSDAAIAGSVGENIAVRTGLSADVAASAVDLWYNENINYDWDNPRIVTRPESLSNHRFTALVWNSSRKLGIGKAVGKDGRTYIVAQYFPTGNIVSRLEQNVFPPKRLASNGVSTRVGGY